jgi:hypothetical protein
MPVLTPPPYRVQDITSQPWQKWFSFVFSMITKFYTENNVVIDSSSNGLVLKDTAGHYWKVTVSVGGVLTTTDLGTTKP